MTYVYLIVEGNPSLNCRVLEICSSFKVPNERLKHWNSYSFISHAYVEKKVVRK